MGLRGFDREEKSEFASGPDADFMKLGDRVVRNGRDIKRGRKRDEEDKTTEWKIMKNKLFYLSCTKWFCNLSGCTKQKVLSTQRKNSIDQSHKGKYKDLCGSAKGPTSMEKKISSLYSSLLLHNSPSVHHIGMGYNYIFK